jgi:hypothetical protein
MMHYLQCDGDVLQTKLRPVKIEDENENDWSINNSGTPKVKMVKNERVPPLFTSKQLIKV